MILETVTTKTTIRTTPCHTRMTSLTLTSTISASKAKVRLNLILSIINRYQPVLTRCAASTGAAATPERTSSKPTSTCSRVAAREAAARIVKSPLHQKTNL